jgi:hypothetical protein
MAAADSQGTLNEAVFGKPDLLFPRRNVAVIRKVYHDTHGLRCKPLATRNKLTCAPDTKAL